MSKIVDPNLPPKLAKKLNAKEKSQKKENTAEKTDEQKASEMVLPQQETLTIVFDEKSQGLIGVNGKLRCNMLRQTDGTQAVLREVQADIEKKRHHGRLHFPCAPSYLRDALHRERD